MPVSKANKGRYPANWRTLATGLKEGTGWRCEGSPAYPDCRAEHGAPHPVTQSTVVLTIGHLDHTPENVARSNLRVWCQRCHLTYDGPHHAANAAATRARKALAASTPEGNC